MRCKDYLFHWRSVTAAVSLVLALVISPDARSAIQGVPLFRLGEVSPNGMDLKFAELVRQSGGDPYLLEEFGRMAFRRSNVNLARQLWELAAKEEKNISSPDVQLIFADMASGQFASAEKRLKDLDLASTTDPHVLIAGAELAMAQKDSKTANDLLFRALDIAPALPVTHLTLGYYMESTGQTETAQTCYEKATELQPDWSPGWLRLASLHFGQNRPGAALYAFQMAEKCRGNQPLAEARMGETYFLQGDLFQAYQQFMTALGRKSDDPFPRLRVAQILQRTGHEQQAHEQLELIIKSDEYPEALRIAADIALKAGDLETAAGYYRRRLKARPDDWVAANNLAMVLVQIKGPVDEATAMIDQAIKSAPQKVPALNGSQGCVLWYAGRADEAKELLREAIVELPSNSWTRYCYGRLLFEKGMPAAAREQLEACKFLDPAFPRLEEVSALIAQLEKDGHRIQPIVPVQGTASPVVGREDSSAVRRSVLVDTPKK